MSGQNKQNFGFYKNIGVKNFNNLSQVGGFDVNVELEMIWDELQNTKSILELGAGTGRVLDFLLSKEYSGNIVAIEQSDEFVDHLEKHYAGKAEIVKADFNDYEFTNTFDVVLWLWSGILDFDEEEQLVAFKKIHAILNPGGLLVIDTPLLGTKTFAEHVDAQRIHLESDYGNLDCYLPSSEEINYLTTQSEFSGVEQVNYKTGTDKERSLYKIRK